MNNVKVSQICTLKNEEYSIKEFIDSLLSQSRSPDDIIIVDGGSTDRTVEILKSYIENGASMKLITESGANIARGRNIAIKNAKYDIIASTDAGCRVEKDWLKYLIKPFEEDPSVDVVSGWYEADARSWFESCVAEFSYPKLSQVVKDSNLFLPSSRSVAFKKSCWEKVGGYPEWLYTAEDTLFDIKLKEVGCKFYFAKNAIVYWRVRSSLKSFLKQQYLYAKGNGEAKLFPPKVLIVGSILQIFLAVLSLYNSIYLILLIAWTFKYALFSLRRIPKSNSNELKNFLLYSTLIFGCDIVQILGYLRGRLQSITTLDK